MAVAHYTNLCIGGQVGEDYYEQGLDLYVLSLLAGVCVFRRTVAVKCRHRQFFAWRDSAVAGFKHMNCTGPLRDTSG